MATKTFEELKQMAIQIRDEKTNKQNTATRIGTQMLEHLNKLEQDYYDKTTLDKRVTELNISELYKTQGIGGTNKYDLATAIAQVPTQYRVAGIKVSFVNENGDTESWEYDGKGWSIGNLAEVGAKKIKELDNYQLVQWNTDNSTTRNQVVNKKRKQGFLLRYLSPDGWVNEFYTGTKIDNVNWGNDNNWKQYVTQKQITNLTPSLALSKDRFRFGDYVTVNNAALYNSSINAASGYTLLICEVKPLARSYRVVLEEGVSLKCITQLSQVPESYNYGTNLSEFITSYSLDPKSSEFVKDTDAIAIAITVMNKVPTSATYFEPVPYSEGNDKKIAEIESKVSEIEQSVEDNKESIDNINTVVNGKTLTANNYNLKTDNAFINGNFIRAIEGYTLCFFTVDEKQTTLTANELQYIDVSHSAYLTEIPSSIKYNEDITSYKISEGNFVEGEGGVTKPAGCKCIAVAFKDGYTEDTYLKISGIASQNIDVSSLQGKLIPKHIFYGKKCTYAGDSLFADPPAVIQRVSELLGMEYNSEETKLTCKGGSMTLGVDDNCGMMRVRRIEAFEKQPDIIIYENVNDNVFGRNKGTIEDKPFMLSKFYDKETSVASLTAVKEYFSTNFDALTTEFTPTVGAMIRLGYISQSFTFTVNSKASTNGTIKITIDGQEFGIEVTTDTAISEIVNLIATQPFEDKGLKLTSTTANSCVYNNKTDSSINKPTFNSNGTGVDISITENTSKINFGYCFMSHDVSKWKDQSEWQAYNEVTGFSVYKGLFEYLMTTFKKTWIFMTITPDWYVFNWESPDPTYLRADGTFDWDKLKVQWDKWHYGELNNFYRDVCKYMKVPVLDTEHESCINIYNASEYYPTNNVHFNQKTEGVERIAQSMVRCLLR